MKNTQNLRLSKPDGSDLVKVSDLNTNWDMLDGIIGSPESLETFSKSSLVGALNEVNAKVEAGVGGGDGNYVLPKASPTVLGGVKVGQGVSIDGNGILSTNGNTAWVNDMLVKIGLLESLTTTAKDSLVNAINEINGKTGGEAENVTWESLTGKPSQFPSSPSLAGLGNVQNFGIATEYDAIAGTSNTSYMTPLRVENKIRNELGWKEIKSNENLDHYKTAGNYYCPMNVMADTITNAPFGATAFSLIVLKNAGCTQVATTYCNGQEAIKIRNEYNGTFGAWVDILTSHNIPYVNNPVYAGSIDIGTPQETNTNFRGFAVHRKCGANVNRGVFGIGFDGSAIIEMFVNDTPNCRAEFRNNDIYLDGIGLKQSVVSGKQEVVNALNDKYGYNTQLTTNHTHGDYAWWIRQLKTAILKSEASTDKTSALSGQTTIFINLPTATVGVQKVTLDVTTSTNVDWVTLSGTNTGSTTLIDNGNKYSGTVTFYNKDIKNLKVYTSIQYSGTITVKATVKVWDV